VINYSSFAHVIEKGMNKRNMTGMAKMLFAFMCSHTGVVHKRITKKDIEGGNTDLQYSVPDRESIQWFRGEHDVAETLKDGAGNADIIAEAPAYFSDVILEKLINPQKTEIVIKEMLELIDHAENLDDKLRQTWKQMAADGDYGDFLANVFLYAVPQPNDLSKIDMEIVAPKLDDEDAREIQMFEALSRKLEKPKADSPPREIAPKEVKYVKQCLMAYASAEQVPCIDREDLETIPKYSRYLAHFDRQRKDFYNADKIRESSKDILKLNEKEGFDLVKGEVFDGVVDVWEMAEDKNGFRRMQEVLSTAASVSLSGHTKRRLLDWIDASEKKGICHILVIDGKLWWVKDEGA